VPGQSQVNGNHAATGETDMLLRTALLALAVAGCATAPALADPVGNVTITLTNLQPQGQVLMQVFNSEAAYGANQALTARQIP